MHAAVSIEEMRSQLLTLDDARECLAATEPLAENTFPTASSILFELGENWAAGAEDQPAPAHLTTPGGERSQLTHASVLEAGAYCGIPRGYAAKLAPDLLAAQLNWWYRQGLGDREFKLLSQDREGDLPPLVRAMCRGTIQPFSNLALLDAALGGIHAKYGAEAEVLVDYKFHHDLERTNIRLVVPGESRVISGTRVEGEDTWCAGVQFSNSLIGVSHPGTSVDGYLFRWWCTNGCTDTLASAGKLARRTVASPADAYEWARRSVDEVLGGLEHTFDAIQALTQVQVAGDVKLVLSDLFAQYGIPIRERHRITELLAELGGELTLYDIQAVITQAANDSSLAPRTVDRLLSLGGHVAHAAHDRCNACRRIMPEGWQATAETGTATAAGEAHPEAVPA